jgi:UDP-N-acetylmuramoylalanine--D-glutamate ligase
MELVAEIGGVRFVNDSKATNVEAALRSVESFEAGLVPTRGRLVQGRRPSPGCVKPLAARAKAVVAIAKRARCASALEGAVDARGGVARQR